MKGLEEESSLKTYSIHVFVLSAFLVFLFSTLIRASPPKRLGPPATKH